MSFFKSLLAISLISFAVHGTVTPAHAENTFLTCVGKGSDILTLSVEISPEEGIARVNGEGLPTEILRLSTAANGRGLLYASKDMQVYQRSPNAPWELYLGDVKFPCARASVNASPSGTNNNAVLNLVGKSLGGNLRAGPGTSFAKVGSTAEGTWLTIVRNTGVNWNGYDWFEIRLDSGKVAFLWGGIMCNNGPKQRGIYQSC